MEKQESEEGDDALHLDHPFPRRKYTVTVHTLFNREVAAKVLDVPGSPSGWLQPLFAFARAGPCTGRQ
jgi:hypothetical protein